MRQPQEDRIAQLRELKPKVLCLGVYIWNHQATLDLLTIWRTLEPQCKIVLGGPEVSYLPPEHELIRLADVVVKGEGDTALGPLLGELLETETQVKGETRLVQGGQPRLEALDWPYSLYSQEDLDHKLTYVESSRGCPFGCEFCLSSLDNRVRDFPLESFLEEMESLIRRGGHQFKFIDRTFNLKLDRAQAIMEFWLKRLKTGMYVHFELVPDRLPPELRDLIRRFPPGSLRLEVGLQTYDPDTALRINRRQDYSLTQENMRFLREETQALVHADLIVGLPGEGLESFARGFDELWLNRPGEVQVGILKKLPGAPIARHDQPWGMKYDENPPYEVLETSVLPLGEMNRLKHFAKFWELIVNRGKMEPQVARLLPPSQGAFERFDSLSRHLYSELGRTWAIPLDDLRQKTDEYLDLKGL